MDIGDVLETECIKLEIFDWLVLGSTDHANFVQEDNSFKSCIPIDSKVCGFVSEYVVNFSVSEL